jgi:hypothetical protein
VSTATLPTVTYGGLQVPDLRPFFKHLHWRPMPHSMGIEVASDWADKDENDPVFGLYKRCGLWTMDEVAILYNCARQFPGGAGLDIGSHTGWTTAHLWAGTGGAVSAMDPLYRGDTGFFARMRTNTDAVGFMSHPLVVTSDEWFETIRRNSPDPWLRVAVIDGDHCSPHPLSDAQNVAKRMIWQRGAILLHDAIGKPVQDAVVWLAEAGFNVKVYRTVHVVAVAWRGEFEPPGYQEHPRVAACVQEHLGGIARWV